MQGSLFHPLGGRFLEYLDGLLSGRLLLGFLLGSGGRRSATTGGSGRSSDAASATGRHGSQLGASLGDQGLEVLSGELRDDL